MAPKAKPPEEPVEEPPEEPPPPPEPTEDEVTELSTGLQLPLRGLDVGRIWALGEDYGAQAVLLAELLSLEEAWPSATQRQIACDLYMYNLSHSKAMCLTQRQAAVFHAIMARVLDLMRCPNTSQQAAPKDMPCDTAKGFQEFQQLLLNHSVSSPPDRLDIFRVSEAKLLTDFASVTLFKHFLLYQFCTNCEQEVQTLRVRRTIQRPLPPPDLASARHRPRPKGWKLKSQGLGQDGVGGGGSQGAPDGSGEADMDAVGGAANATSRDLPEDSLEGAVDGVGAEAVEDVSPEEQEINRLVSEKLAEKERELEAKLAEREEAFLQKFTAKQEEAKAGKKK